MSQTSESNIPVDNDKLLIGLDGEIQSIAKQMEIIPWLEKSWGRAKNISASFLDQVWKGSNARVQDLPNSFPYIYISDKEYYSVMPNDTYKAYSFWGVSGQSIGKDQANGINYSKSNFEAPVYLIVWVNLRAIDKTKDYIFTQELIKDVLKQLRRKSNFTLTQVFDERVEDIFKGFSLTPEKRDLLMYPFQAFRIEGKLNYILNLC